MKAVSREALELVVEKANRIRRSRLAQSPINMNAQWSATEGNRVAGIEEDDIDAVLLAIRFFVQKREPSSLARLAEGPTNDPGVSEEWKTSFSRLRDSTNEIPDEPPSLPVSFDGEVPTHRVIFDTFLNGSRAHANDPKARERFKRWKSLSWIGSVLEFRFHCVLFGQCAVAIELGRISEKELVRSAP